MPFDVVGEQFAHAIDVFFGASQHDVSWVESHLSFGQTWVPLGPIAHPRFLRHHITAFEDGPPGAKEAEAKEGKMADEMGKKAGEELAANNNKPPPPAGEPPKKWQNAKGYSMASVAEKASEIWSKDIGDFESEDIPGKFNPVFGCKCGHWGPALTHPTIEFQKPFLEQHKDLAQKLHKLKVHLEDDTKQPPVVHWDAVYDLRRFMHPEDHSVPKLKETDPAVVDSGEQTRFKTFCPPPGEEHKYTLKVTALDGQDQAIPYAKELEMKLTAKENAFTPATTTPAAQEGKEEPGNEGEAPDEGKEGKADAENAKPGGDEAKEA